MIVNKMVCKLTRHNASLDSSLGFLIWDDSHVSLAAGYFYLGSSAVLGRLFVGIAKSYLFDITYLTPTKQRQGDILKPIVKNILSFKVYNMETSQ